jgi:membrane protease subunit HflK
MPWNDHANPGPWGTPPGHDEGKSGGEPARRPEPPRRPSPPPGGPDFRDLQKRLTELARRWLGRANTPGMRPQILLAIVGAMVVAWMLTGLYTVQANQEAVITRFGGYARSEGPGLHYHLPIPLERAEFVSVTNQNKTVIGGTPGAEAPDESLMLTGDENIVDLSFAVQWHVSDAASYLFRIKDPDDAVKAVAESAMREVVGRSVLKSILTNGRGAVQDQTLTLMQHVLDQYHSGIAIDAVQIQNANPPAEVVPAYQDIAKAGQEAQSAINDANTYRNKVVNEAHGDAAKIVQAAQGYREQVVRYAQGQASAFDQLYPQYRRAPGITRERLYLEMMERVLGHSHKVIIDGKGTTAPIILPPDLFKGNAAIQVAPPSPAAESGQ